MRKNVRVAVVQAETARDLPTGLELTTALVRAAAGDGAELIAFPETWLPGYPVWLDVCSDVGLWDHAPVKAVFARMHENSVAIPSVEYEALAALARAHGVTLVIGVVERIGQGAGRGTLYNTLVTIGADGRLLNHHRKLIPTHTERMVWGTGDAEGLRAVDTPAGRVGGLICWEHWMPLARQAMHDSGEDMHVAVWPTAHELLQVVSRAYAFEGRCFVLVAGSLMRTASLPPELELAPHKLHACDDFVMRGGSAIIGPNGAYIVEPVYAEARTIIVDLDLTRIREESMTLDVSGHYARPDLLHLHVTRDGHRFPGEGV